MAGEVLGRSIADIRDAEAEDETIEWLRLRLLDAPQQIVDARLAHAVERDQLLPPVLQPVNARQIGDQAELEEAVDELPPEALDIHGTAGDEVADLLGHLCRARLVRALERHLVLGLL